MECSIIIPLFRSKPLWYEIAAIKQAIKVLHGYTHILVVPKGLDLTAVLGIYQNANKTVLIEEFNSSYFVNTQSYNRLMLSASFYERFADSNYLLIYQTDAWVFSDELQKWMAMDYDYIGAPWVDWIHASTQAKETSLLLKLKWKLGLKRIDAVGNGGLSLRKVSAMCTLLDLHCKAAESYMQNEDLFFAFEAKKLGAPIRIPNVQTALRFAFDENPAIAWKMNNKQLPMGCHAWQKHLHFWKAVSPEINQLTAVQ